jgi:excisionase family DNA binding protein
MVNISECNDKTLFIITREDLLHFAKYINQNEEKTIIPFPQWMNIKQVSEYTGLSVPTIRKKIESRKIPFKQIGRLYKFNKDDIEDWLQKGSEHV